MAVEASGVEKEEKKQEGKTLCPPGGKEEGRREQEEDSELEKTEQLEESGEKGALFGRWLATLRGCREVR